MFDSTEMARRALSSELAAGSSEREALEAKYGKLWTTDEMCADFDAEGFMAPFVVVREKATGKRGSLMFSGRPRFYYGFSPA